MFGRAVNNSEDKRRRKRDAEQERASASISFYTVRGGENKRYQNERRMIEKGSAERDRREKDQIHHWMIKFKSHRRLPPFRTLSLSCRACQEELCRTEA